MIKRLFAKHPVLTAAAAVALGSLGVGTALWACADSSCYPGWQLGALEYDCAGRALISPGNDTRINLIMLMQSIQPGQGLPAEAKVDVNDPQFGKVFLSWEGLRSSLWPEPEMAEPEYDEKKCYEAMPGSADFLEALAADKGVPAGERAALTTLRETTGCHEGEWNDAAVASQQGRAFLAYLKAADAFHKADYAAADAGFAALARSGNPWIAETARYMPIRIGLRRAAATSLDEWGDFAGPEKVDRAALTSAAKAIDAYLAAYPKGRYADSAQGLKRRVAWLGGDTDTLVGAYEALLKSTPASSIEAAYLAEEIDRKLLEREDASAVVARQGKAPLLLALADMKRMRPVYDGPAVGFSAAELAAHKPQLSGYPDLYGLLEATRITYAGENAQPILSILPDAARAKGMTPLAFSRQMVRGQALSALRDPNEAGFWRELIGAASPFHQRPLAELALALLWQRDGRVDQAFAPGSPVQEQSIREVLLQTIASPAILRASAADASRPGHERDVARFTLLHKDLTRGAFADFTRDVALVPAGANTDGGLWGFARQEQVPVGLFTKGQWSDGFACPAIAQTAATLARNPADQRARLCLGDFWRLNGFDGFALHTPGDGVNVPGPMVLGNAADQFPGKASYRDAIYAAIIANKAAPAELRAYALYRAVRCYAPSGNNGCAGPSRTMAEYEAAQVPLATRKGWYDELKKRYPQSQWAKALRFYW
ncbi:hypothetical protein [Novosphingobium jiangmenense]|uniref:Outer membrane assembly lipoprotein YfiO n=1 Tax=Novosphingobium jiangmenense TaxID=2791981 RepID=A0ABS0HC20_9SPHN|nr:hypothetical protein [Novosphingobium jiangmenense]MBF9149838.1 hypothetical protein [Novosphingobium jiangmenense]